MVGSHNCGLRVTLLEASHRRYFYKNGRLVREGLIRVSERRIGHGDLNDCLVEVDRRMLDYLVGLDTELDEMVEGMNIRAHQRRLVTSVANDGLLVCLFVFLGSQVAVATSPP